LFYELNLLQMRGAGHEAVVLHCECPATKQMKQDRLAWKVKEADYFIKFNHLE